MADHEILREGMRAILDVEPDLEVVGVAGRADDLLQIVEQRRPDVVLMNPAVVMNGPDICARLVERHPRLRVLLVSTYSEIDVVKACISAGAHGYVIKDVDRPQLAQAVRELHRGEVTVSSAVAARIIDQMRALVRVRTKPGDWMPVNVVSSSRADDAAPWAAGVPALAQLTRREEEVLARLMDGQRVAWIAADLFVSQSTVRDHLSSIFKKVGVRSQAELIRRLRLD